jgi:hypothetical protein
MVSGGRLVCCTLALGFAAAVGHVAWNAFAGPPPMPEYHVEADGPILCGPDPTQKVLYLRRTLFLKERPRHAWLEVVGRDRLQVYVNGRVAGEKNRAGFAVAVVINITALLKPGENVLAIRTEQVSFDHPPAVAIRGAYVLGQELPIPGDSSWRCNHAASRGAVPWLFAKFNDKSWAPARVTPGRLRGEVDGPPRAQMEPSGGKWISPSTLATREAAFRGDLEVAGRPRQAWLRVTPTASFVLAVNGIILDAPESELGTERETPPVQYIYDLTSVVRRGKNEVALLLTSPDQLPHLLADLEIEDTSGARYRLSSGDDWRTRPGLAADWCRPDRDTDSSWQPARVEAGDLYFPPWRVTRKLVAFDLPAALVVERLAGEALLIGLVAMLTLLCCWLAGRWLNRQRPEGVKEGAAAVVYLALVPATIVLAAAILATFDPRITSQDVYRVRWLILAVASVPLQWVLLALVVRRPALRLPRFSLGRSAEAALLVLLILLGFGLRMRDILTENLMQDEVHAYDGTMGMFQRGYPSIAAHPNMPVKYWSASELCFVGRGLVALVTDDARWVMRFPQIVFGTLVIGLIWVVGRRMFGRAVAWLSAVTYTISPVCIAMSDIGRYFEQTQFFTLLTVYYFWLALRGCGPVNGKYVWFTAISFILAYLSWEGAGLLAPGMMLAAVVLRRGRVTSVLGRPVVWAGLAVVLMAILLQNTHQMFQASQRLRYGTGAGAITVAPMWLYATFEPWYYVREASWNADTFLPMLGLALAGLLAIRHPWRERLRFLLLIHLSGCLLLSALVSIKASRYIHHQTPFLILLASAGFVGWVRPLVRLVGRAPTPQAWRGYGATAALLVVLVILVLGSGHTLRLSQMDRFQGQGYTLDLYKFPAVEGAVHYMRERLRPGDVVLATATHQVNHMMGRPGWGADYFLETYPPLEELTDISPVPVEHRSGSGVISNRRELENLFARHDRIWYVAQIGAYWANTDTFAFVRDHMEVVYEDVGTLLLFRGDRHWSADQRATQPVAPSPRPGLRPQLAPPPARDQGPPAAGIAPDTQGRGTENLP